MRLGAGGAGNGARSEGVGAVVKPRLGRRLRPRGSDPAGVRAPRGSRWLRRVPAPGNREKTQVLFGLGAKKWGLCVNQVLPNQKMREKRLKYLFYRAPGAGVASAFCSSGRWFCGCCSSFQSVFFF